MSSDKFIFTKLEDFDGGVVTFGDGKTTRVIGIGSILVPGIPKLNNAFLLDGLRANLISISQMCDDNHEVYFSKFECHILDINGKSILHGTSTFDNCYDLFPSSHLTCHLATINNVDFWHKRLGHVNFKDLLKLENSKIVNGIPKLRKPENPVCGPCQTGKLQSHNVRIDIDEPRRTSLNPIDANTMHRSLDQRAGSGSDEEMEDVDAEDIHPPPSFGHGWCFLTHS